MMLKPVSDDLVGLHTWVLGMMMTVNPDGRIIGVPFCLTPLTQFVVSFGRRISTKAHSSINPKTNKKPIHRARVANPGRCLDNKPT